MKQPFVLRSAVNHRRGLTALGALLLLFLLLETPRLRAQTAITLVADGASALHALINQWNLELKNEAYADSNRAKIFQVLKKAQEQLQPMKQTATDNATVLDKQMAQQRAEHGNDGVENWSDRDRNEYNRLKEAHDTLDNASKALDTARDNLKAILSVQNDVTNPLGTKPFRDRLDLLAKQIGTAEQSFKKYSTEYRVEPSSGGRGGSELVRAGAAHISTTSKEMQFEVNGVTLSPGPGGKTSADIGFGDRRSIKIRALAYDPNRRTMLTAAPRIKAKEMPSVTISEEALPYKLKYGNATLTTSLRSMKETYVWELGNQVSVAINRSSPWARNPEVILPPKVDISSRVGSTNDVLTWNVPAVESGSVEFTFSVVGTVRWLVGRTPGAEREESTTTSGTLSLVVSR